MSQFQYPPVDAVEVHRAVEILRAGGLVAIPTETVYGLAADADNEKAVMATFAVKGRPTNHPLIVHVANADALSAWARVVPPEARLLAEKFWPGPLTMVLPKSERCQGFVTGGQDSVAIRCPSHPWMQALLKEFAGDNFRAVTAPSCNTFGRISPTSAQHVADDLGVKPTGKLDMILDGGVCEVGVESTILNLSGDRPEILRHGAVTREMLEAVLGVPVPDAGSNAPRASGRLKSHYAPKTKVRLLAADAIEATLRNDEHLAAALMVTKVTQKKLADSGLLTSDRPVITAPETEAAYAHELYDNLHRLDAFGADVILIECPPTSPDWAAVNDRLGRAAAEKDKA